MRETTEHTKQLHEGLLADARFAEVRHARHFICQDEMEDSPNLLTLDYRGAQFFAEVGTSSGRPIVRLSIPNKETVVLAEMGDLDTVCQGLDLAITPDIVVSQYGDALRFPPDTDEDAYTFSTFNVPSHATCGGAMDWNLISDGYQAVACRKCNLRVVFPTDIRTAADLRSSYTLEDE